MAGIMQPSASDLARMAQLNRQIASLPSDVREQIQAEYAASQVTVLPLPYWSTVRFQGVRAAGPPVTFTIDTTQRLAFSYAQGSPMTSAGFAVGRNATAAETNLLRSNETRDNADYWIWGISAYATQDSEPALLKQVWRHVYIALALNGTQQIPLGTLEMFPSAGGLYGAAPSALKAPDLATPGGSGINNGAGAIVPFASNGNPMAANFFRLQQPFKWSAVGTASSDSSLIISATPQTAITETCALARVAAAGVSAFDPPAATGDAGTFVDVRFRLIGVGIQRRSNNV